MKRDNDAGDDDDDDDEGGEGDDVDCCGCRKSFRQPNRSVARRGRPKLLRDGGA